MATWRVEVTGFRELINALQEADKRAANTIIREITNAGKRAATNASYLVPGKNPVSGWGKWIDAKTGRDLSYEPATVSASFKLRRNNFKRRGISAGIGWDLYQTNPGGAIFELLGTGSSQFVESVSGRYNRKQPRTLIPAYYSVMTEDFQKKIHNMILTEARKAGLD